MSQCQFTQFHKYGYTVEPHLTVTSLLRKPPHYSHCGCPKLNSTVQITPCNRVTSPLRSLLLSVVGDLNSIPLIPACTARPGLPLSPPEIAFLESPYYRPQTASTTNDIANRHHTTPLNQSSTHKTMTLI